jgi:hypothetical protein
MRLSRKALSSLISGGMMGAAVSLGCTVEGTSGTVVTSRPARTANPPGANASASSCHDVQFQRSLETATQHSLKVLLTTPRSSFPGSCAADNRGAVYVRDVTKRGIRLIAP